MYKQLAIHSIGVFYLIILVLLVISSVIVVKNDALLRKPSNRQIKEKKARALLRTVLEGFFKGVG